MDCGGGLQREEGSMAWMFLCIEYFILEDNGAVTLEG